MKLNKRLPALLMAGVLSLSLLAGCGGSDYKVGVCQLAPHPALDAATEGFRDKLTELMKADGKTVEIDVENANGETSSVATIINGFVSGKSSLILANATAPLQTAAASTGDIPILGTSVSDYGTALEMDNFTGVTGINVSGTSDLAPLDQQAAMVKEWFPDAKNVGLLYCSSEANSKFQINTIKPELEALGFACTEYSFADSNDLATVATKACNESDVLYVPTDNTVADNTGIIANIAIPNKIPVIAGEEGICSGCGVATLSINYRELGETTAQMAYDILVGGKDISTMEIQYAPNLTKKYNKEICDELGLTPPEGYEAIESAE
ncbi:ABC transporter substrate-binding protein [Intestinibacillus massiliensis]|uniref:ABC transporter substrate-binding protein n=1 Tax=Intestinibacillus massiliensis TaxID=1871029 RepID=UPI000B352DCF|nr:ABC transporter substrate-binding protein [Intestinibacillus massiliensis]